MTILKPVAIFLAVLNFIAVALITFSIFQIQNEPLDIVILLIPNLLTLGVLIWIIAKRNTTDAGFYKKILILSVLLSVLVFLSIGFLSGSDASTDPITSDEEIIVIEN